MSESGNKKELRVALPKGRMQEEVFRLLGEAGIRMQLSSRNYRPTLSLPDSDTKILKPQNIIEMLHVGSRDIGFAGADWVQELDADVIELLDTGLNPVRLVAAAPQDLLVDGKLPDKEIVVASEYERLTRNWISDTSLNANFVRTYGATEVFPPEDADCIVDNTATGSTLRVNQLEIVDVLMISSTRLYANAHALEDTYKCERIDHLVLLLRSVLEARQRVMLEVNVNADNLDALVKLLPCMRTPTISPLYGQTEYAVKAAVPRDQLPTLIPKIKAQGGTDIVVTAPDQLVP